MNQWFGHLLLSSMGLAAAGVLVVIIRAVLRREPVACYRMLVILLIAALTLPALQLTLQGCAAGERPAMEQWLAKVWFTEHHEVAVLEPRIVEAASSPTEAPAIDALPPISFHEAPLFGPRAEGNGIQFLEPRPAEAAEPSPPLEESAVVSPPLAPRGRDWSRWSLAPWLALIWLTGVVVAARWQISRLRNTYGLVRRSRPVESETVLALWASVAGSKHRIRLRVSDEITSPATWGLLRPALLLPTRDVENLRADVLEWALRHELVHIRRGDARTAAIQGVLTTLFWFHPVAWWLSSLLDGLRELSCDHLVVRGHGHRRSYALALLDYACGVGKSTKESPAPAHGLLVPWSGSASQLKRRIKMLEKTRQVRGARDRLVTWTSMVAMLATLWGGQLAIAATLIPAPQEEPSETPSVPCLCDEKETPQEEPAPVAIPTPEPHFPAELPPLRPLKISGFEFEGQGEPVEVTAPAFPGGPFPTPVDGASQSPFESAIALAPQAATCDRRIGVKLKRVGEALASHLNVDPSKALLIDAVAEGSPAERSGLERHDVLVGVNGHLGITVESLRDAVKRTALGHALQLDVVRGCRDHGLQVKITDWQAEGFWAQPFKPGPDQAPKPTVRSRRNVKGGQHGGTARRPTARRPIARRSIARRPVARNVPRPSQALRLRATEAPKPPKVAQRLLRGADAEAEEIERTLRSFEKSRRKIEQEIRKVERELRELQNRERRRSRTPERRSRRRGARGHKAPIGKVDSQVETPAPIASETPRGASVESVPAQSLGINVKPQHPQTAVEKLQERKTSLESALKFLERKRTKADHPRRASTPRAARGMIQLD